MVYKYKLQIDNDKKKPIYFKNHTALIRYCKKYGKYIINWKLYFSYIPRKYNLLESHWKGKSYMWMPDEYAKYYINKYMKGKY